MVVSILDSPPTVSSNQMYLTVPTNGSAPPAPPTPPTSTASPASPAPPALPAPPGSPSSTAPPALPAPPASFATPVDGMEDFLEVSCGSVLVGVN